MVSVLTLLLDLLLLRVRVTSVTSGISVTHPAKSRYAGCGVCFQESCGSYGSSSYNCSSGGGDKKERERDKMKRHSQGEEGLVTWSLALCLVDNLIRFSSVESSLVPTLHFTHSYIPSLNVIVVAV